MKNKALLFSAIAFALSFSACNDEMMDNSTTPVDVGQEVKHVSVTLPDVVYSSDDVDTRAEIIKKPDPNNPSKEVFGFAWTSGDVLGVFPNKGAQVDFPIDEAYVGTNSAEFDGGGWALKAGYTYAVYYPYDYYNRDKTAIPMSYLGQTQKKANDNSHLNAFNYFASNAAITADETGVLNFSVEYLGTIIWMPFTFSENLTLKEIRLVSDNLPFITQANLDISGPTPVVTPTAESQTISLKLNNIAVSAGVQSNFYMWVLPRDYRESKLTAEVVTTNDDVYEVTLYPVGGNSELAKGSFKNLTRPNGTYSFTLKGSETNKAIDAMNDLYTALGNPSALSNWTAATSEAAFDGKTGVKVEDGKITELNLSGVTSGGYIPESIGNLTNLKVLDLSSNGLTGSIPESIGNLTNLTYLDLNGNNLTSAVVSGAPKTAEEAGSSMAPTLATAFPTTIGNLTKLTYLDLSYNKLSGELPLTLSNLKKLVQLYLNNNNLSGSLPTSIGNLPLELLDLSNNNFIGDFVQWFFNDLPEIPTLRYLYVEYNKLTGVITEELQNLSRWKNLEDIYVESQQVEDITIDDGTVSAPKATIEDFTETNYGW